MNTFEALGPDMRYGWRMLWKNPGITSVALLSLALGIGATTCIFSVIYGVLISPYPYAKTNEIWAPEIRDAKNPGPRNGRGVFWPYEFRELQKLPGVSVAMATLPEEALLTGDRAPETITIPLVTPGAFDFLGVKPVLGRTIGDGDWRPDGEPEDVIVLSYKAWFRYFDGSPDALGKTLVINDRKVAVIGVMPPRFGWFTSEGGWMPFPKNPPPERWVVPIVRLKPGITSAVATEQLQAIESRLQAEHPSDFPKGSSVLAYFKNYMDVTVASGDMRNSLALLFGAVGFLLLIACANVANLQMARATSRAREIALRMAIGASRGRVWRQLLTESVLLSITGGLLGMAVAIGLTNAVVAIMPSFYVPNEARITVNVYVLAFSAVVSIATGILFGLVPALQCSKPDLVEDLKGKGSSDASAGGRTRGALVIIEVALSVVLLVGASLTIRGFVNLQHVELGFNPDHTVMVSVQMNPKKYETYDQRVGLVRDVLARVKTLPGVTAAAIGNGGFPFGGWRSTFAIDGAPADDSRFLFGSMVSDGYTKTLGVALRAGRELTELEIAHGDHVGMINETLARMWPAGENPIGRRVRVDVLGKPNPSSPPLPGKLDPFITVVGILADTRNSGLREPTTPAVYFPYTLTASAGRLLLYRAQGDPLLLLNSVRQQVLAIDKEQPLGNPYTLEQILGFETVQPKFNMALFTFFGMLGLTLATVGIFSVLSYMVARRTHEIGIRMALGAETRDVVRLTMRSGGALVAIGIATGLAGSFALAAAIRSTVFSVPVTDPLAIGGVIVVMSISAALACLIPARRASRVEPMIALRNE